MSKKWVVKAFENAVKGTIHHGYLKVVDVGYNREQLNFAVPEITKDIDTATTFLTEYDANTHAMLVRFISYRIYYEIVEVSDEGYKRLTCA